MYIHIMCMYIYIYIYIYIYTYTPTHTYTYYVLSYTISKYLSPEQQRGRRPRAGHMACLLPINSIAPSHDSRFPSNDSAWAPAHPPVRPPTAVM